MVVCRDFGAAISLAEMWASETHNEWIEKTNRKLLLLLPLFSACNSYFALLELFRRFSYCWLSHYFGQIENKNVKCWRSLPFPTIRFHSECEFRATFSFSEHGFSAWFWSIPYFILSLSLCVHNCVHVVQFVSCGKTSGRKLRIGDFLFKRSFEDPIKFKAVVKIWMNCHWNANKTVAKRNARRIEIGSKAIQLKRKVTDMCSGLGDVSKGEGDSIACALHILFKYYSN